MSGRQQISLILGTLLFISPLFSQESETSQSSKISVDLVVATDVEDRSPVGAADSFSNETPSVVAWTHVKGATEPMEITHEWSHDGKVIASVPLNVQSSSFRTWSRKTLYGLAGTWTIEVKDGANQVLASKTFEVSSPKTP